MQAYVLKLKLRQTALNVWRRFIIPSVATFHELHETIQRATSFNQKGHYVFATERLYVTNDAYVVEQSKEDATLTRSIEFSTKVLLSSIFEQECSVTYEYDGWVFDVQCEERVDDYPYGHPSLLGGANDAPPEQMKGPETFEQFLTSIHNPDDPRHGEYKIWGQLNGFRMYHPERVNEALESIQVTEDEPIASSRWERPEHEIPAVIDREEIVRYAIACAQLYGIASLTQLVDAFTEHYGPVLTEDEAAEVFDSGMYDALLQRQLTTVYPPHIMHEQIRQMTREEVNWLVEEKYGKPSYIPTYDEWIRYASVDYEEETEEVLALKRALLDDFRLTEEEALTLIWSFVRDVRWGGRTEFEAVQDWLAILSFDCSKQMKRYFTLVSNVFQTTRLWSHNGYSSEELSVLRCPLPSDK